MQASSREQVMTALATAVFGVADFKTTGRRVLLWSKVSAQPACFLRNVADAYERDGVRQQAKVTMHAEIWVYSQAGKDPDEAPGIDLNNLIDAIEGVFVSDDTSSGRFTLGGLVQHAWIEGDIEYDPGDLDGQAKAVIPVKILVPKFTT